MTLCSCTHMATVGVKVSNYIIISLFIAAHWLAGCWTCRRCRTALSAAVRGHCTCHSAVMMSRRRLRHWSRRTAAAVDVSTASIYYVELFHRVRHHHAVSWPRRVLASGESLDDQQAPSYSSSSTRLTRPRPSDDVTVTTVWRHVAPPPIPSPTAPQRRLRRLD